MSSDDTAAGDELAPPLDCCGGLGNVDYSKMDLTLLKFADFHDPSFCVAVVAIAFNPLFWNVDGISPRLPDT
ncbi:hypothetical protein EYF80_046745 [Liparis tanakae]|uniref:Phosphatidylethanolamine N-methyltransferase n=1 Tax=Liparis tanakae TaxID=230148 RepID=A0A4Z2FPB4_9TELE|nr:hypothetical protein EYF80_046745 [Liparis tanakae]